MNTKCPYIYFDGIRALWFQGMQNSYVYFAVRFFLGNVKLPPSHKPYTLLHCVFYTESPTESKSSEEWGRSRSCKMKGGTGVFTRLSWVPWASLRSAATLTEHPWFLMSLDLLESPNLDKRKDNWQTIQTDKNGAHFALGDRSVQELCLPLCWIEFYSPWDVSVPTLLLWVWAILPGIFAPHSG